MIHELVACTAAHRALALYAESLSRSMLPSGGEDAERLRLGASCIRLSLSQAVGARDEWSSVQRWLECARAERQIRAATASALKARRIINRDYDRLFRVAAEATRLRRTHIQLLRERLQRLAIV